MSWMNDPLANAIHGVLVKALNLGRQHSPIDVSKDIFDAVVTYLQKERGTDELVEHARARVDGAGYLSHADAGLIRSLVAEVERLHASERRARVRGIEDAIKLLEERAEELTDQAREVRALIERLQVKAESIRAKSSKGRKAS